MYKRMRAVRVPESLDINIFHSNIITVVFFHLLGIFVKRKSLTPHLESSQLRPGYLKVYADLFFGSLVFIV